jgi:hypothetical protein
MNPLNKGRSTGSKFDMFIHTELSEAQGEARSTQTVF